MIDDIIDVFVDTYPEELSIVLLQIVAFQEQGGQGYSIQMFSPTIDMDGWEVDEEEKIIYLDNTGLFSNYTIADHAEHLKYAIETKFLKTRATLFSRYAWGTGKIVLGTVEVILGAVGVVVPEPGTTVGGVVLFTLGVNGVIDGISQISGANQGNGINLLGGGFAWTGEGIAKLSDIDPEIGREAGEMVFVISSIAVGSIASIKIIQAPGKAFFRLGVGGQPGGLQLGRLDMLYGSLRAKDGMTVLSINNNANKSILRFVIHSGKLTVNGRIFGVSKILKHETNAKEILKGLLKLLAHGKKF